MNNNQEKVSEVVTEMREYLNDTCGYWMDGLSTDRFGAWLDRLEAAISPTVPMVCANCKHYNSKQQYCPINDCSICRREAQKFKAIGCEKWEAE